MRVQTELVLQLRQSDFAGPSRLEPPPDSIYMYVYRYISVFVSSIDSWLAMTSSGTKFGARGQRASPVLRRQRERSRQPRRHPPLGSRAVVLSAPSMHLANEQQASKITGMEAHVYTVGMQKPLYRRQHLCQRRHGSQTHHTLRASPVSASSANLAASRFPEQAASS